MKIKKLLNLDFKNCLFIIHNDEDGAGCEVVAKVYMPDKWLNFKMIDAKDGDIALKNAINSGLYDLIIMGDCSFKSKESLDLVLDYIVGKNQFFLVDHHENAMEFKDFDWAFVSIAEFCDGVSVKNSGTELMYQFLNQQIRPKECKTIKEFVELSRSYDTWDWFKTKDQGPVDLVALFEFDYKMFVDEMIYNINHLNPVFDKKQKFLLEVLNTMNKAYIDKSVDAIDFFYHDNKKIAILVANQLQGLIANEVFNRYPDVSFIVCVVSPTKLSFRSSDGREEIFTLVHSLGGGGHRNAGGCDIPNKLIDAVKEFVFK